MEIFPIQPVKHLRGQALMLDEKAWLAISEVSWLYIFTIVLIKLII